MATKKEISAFFNHLDVETCLETISDRIKIQKLVYLAEVFGLDTGFSFTWYVYGPYSPELTKVMFDSTNGRSSGLGETKSDLKKIQALKDYLGDDIQSSDKLELVASLHYVLSIALKTDSSEQDALDLFYDEKPQFSEKLVRSYLPKVKKLLK